MNQEFISRLSELVWAKIPQSNVLAIRLNHYENMSIQIYWEFYHQKNENFQMKNFGSFHISAQNKDYGYLLEPPRVSKLMFTAVNPIFFL